MSICNRLDLETQGSRPMMPKNIPGHWAPRLKNVTCINWPKKNIQFLTFYNFKCRLWSRLCCMQSQQGCRSNGVLSSNWHGARRMTHWRLSWRMRCMLRQQLRKKFNSMIPCNVRGEPVLSVMAAGWFCEKSGWIGKVEDVKPVFWKKEMDFNRQPFWGGGFLPRWIVK